MARNNFYPSSGNGRTEIDLRQEMKNTMYGNGPEIAKSQTGLLRRFRLDNNQKFIPCACVSTVTGEPDKETKCPVCFGEGKLWDEELISFYYRELEGDSALAERNVQKPHSIVNTPLSVFYIESTFTLTGQDKIVLLNLDTEGKPLRPYQRRTIFRINSLRDLRLDQARLEFWKANCYEDTNKFL